MTGIRKHYMTLCIRDSIVITYRVIDSIVQVTFEQAKSGRFNTLVTDVNGTIISNDGYNSTDVEFLLSFQI